MKKIIKVLIASILFACIIYASLPACKNKTEAPIFIGMNVYDETKAVTTTLFKNSVYASEYDYTATVGDEITVALSFENPNGYDIVSFYLNDIKYSGLISGTFLKGSTDEQILVRYNVGEEVGVHSLTVSQIKYLTDSSVETSVSDVIMGKGASDTITILVEPVPPKIPSLNYIRYTAGPGHQVTTYFGSSVKLPVEYVSVTVDGVLIEEPLNIRQGKYYEWYFGEYESAVVVWRYQLDDIWYEVTTVIK